MKWTDIEGWLSEEEGKKLQELADGKTVLELGTNHGRSAACMAQTAFRVVTVDAHWRDTLEKCKSNMLDCGVGHNVVIMKCNHKDLVRSTFLEKFGLVFIDGAHDFDSVVRDTKLAMSVLRFGGIIVWHDFWGNDYPGVKNAVQHCGFKGVEFHGRAGSLAWSY